VFFEDRQKLFQFRSTLSKAGDRQQGYVKKQSAVPKGQYKFPFTITLPLPDSPSKLCETFKFRKLDKKGN
jgi:hypothetical protein